MVWLRGWWRWMRWRYSAKEWCPYCRLTVKAKDMLQRELNVVGPICRHCIEETNVL